MLSTKRHVLSLVFLAGAVTVGCSTASGNGSTSLDVTVEDILDVVGDATVVGLDATSPSDALEQPEVGSDASPTDTAPPPEDVASDDTPSDGFTTPSSSDELWLATELLGRPHASGITLNMVPAVPLNAYVETSPFAGGAWASTPVQSGIPGEPMVFELTGLAPSTRYRYRVRVQVSGQADFATRAERRFQTPRSPGEPFVFTLQADSHLDDKSSVELYHRTLTQAGADEPDFHIDLGDTFMCDKHSEPLTGVVKAAESWEVVAARYLYEREHFGLLAHSAALFLVNGNHEGESGFELDGTENNVAVWATRARKRYYPNPEPNGTYSAPSEPAPSPLVGARQHPYAWTWGDALFVVIDPFWYTMTKVKPDGSRWGWTLGKAQYDWLRSTLLGSQSKFKFVFAHHLVGGSHSASRGGIEAAPYFEWGGKELDGTDTFAVNRPGWASPIHALFVEAKVSAFFHGHDHVYVHQELDGVIYQELPQPSATNAKNAATLAAEAGYVSGTILPSSGHLRVTVGPEAAKVEYVRAYLPKDEVGGVYSGSIDHSYVILPSGAPAGGAP